jgi:catechol 2,3-dioxygenase-like lactoylglutathione lyase family enzyme
MLTGAHAIIYSKDAEADRAFLRDVLGLPHVDSGGGWLIFGLPPSELAVHPGERSGVHEVYLLTDDVARFVADMGRRGVACGPIQAMSWGALTEVTLPGGGALGVYQPRHARPEAATPPRAARKKAGSKAKGTSRGTAKPARAKPRVTARRGARKATEGRASRSPTATAKPSTAIGKRGRTAKASGKAGRTRGRT